MSDTHLFLGWLSKQPKDKLSCISVDNITHHYQSYLRNAKHAESTIKRHTSTLNKYVLFLKSKGYIKEMPTNGNNKKKLIYNPSQKQETVSKKNNEDNDIEKFKKYLLDNNYSPQEVEKIISHVNDLAT